jgi:hypothetical protein
MAKLSPSKFPRDEHDKLGVIDVLEEDGSWRQAGVYAHKRDTKEATPKFAEGIRVVLYFGKHEYEGLGNSVYRLVLRSEEPRTGTSNARPEITSTSTSASTAASSATSGENDPSRRRSARQTGKTYSFVEADDDVDDLLDSADDLAKPLHKFDGDPEKGTLYDGDGDVVHTRIPPQNDGDGDALRDDDEDFTEGSLEPVARRLLDEDKGKAKASSGAPKAAQKRKRTSIAASKTQGKNAGVKSKSSASLNVRPVSMWACPR